MKKKRKRMQGYAMRYLALSATGTLQYSVSPGSPVRDEIEIPHARVLSSPKDLSIHVDNGEVVFHLRMLTEPDFALWRETLRDLVLHAPDAPLAPRPIFAPKRDTHDLAHEDLAPVLRSVGTMQRLVHNARAEPLVQRAEQGLSTHLARIDEHLQAISTFLDANVPARPVGCTTTSSPGPGWDRGHRPAGSFADVDFLCGDAPSPSGLGNHHAAHEA